MEFTAQEVRDLQYVYNTFDVHGRGLIDFTELRKALSHLGFKVNRKTLQQLFQNVARALDASNKAVANHNEVDFEGFLHIVAKLQGTSYDQQEEILRAFSYMDSDDDGFISSADLYRHACEVGLSFNDVQEMIKEADMDGDGKLSQKEFLHVMKRTNLFKQ